MKIGDLVQEYVGGPVMQIVGWLDSCRVAICRVLGTGAVKFVTAVALMCASVSGHPPEDPPSGPVIERTVDVVTVGTSGAMTAFGLDQEQGWAPRVQRIPWNPVVFRDDEALPPSA